MSMKKFMTALILLAACASGAFAQDDAPLAALLLRAASDNPQIAASKQRTAAAEAQIIEANAKMLPKVNVGTGALWQRDGLSQKLPDEMSFLGVFNLPVGYRNTYAAAVALTQVIYSGGTLPAQKEAAKLSRDSLTAQEIRTQESVSNAVRRAYYGLRRAQAKELVARDAVTLAKRHLAQADKLFKAGVVAKSDVLRSKVAVSSAELDLIRMQNASAVALVALRRAVGSELSGPLDELRGLDAILADDAGFDVNTAGADVETAFERRQELRVYALLAKQAEKLARAAKGQTLPQVIGSIGYVAADDKFFPTEQSEPIAALGAYWNLYDGGEMRAKTAEAKAKAQEMLFLLEDMKNGIRMEVTQAELNIRSAQSRLETARMQLASSREDYRIAVRRYDEKVGTNLDTLDARLALTDSMSEVINAVYDIKTAEADLIYAVGERR